MAIVEANPYLSGVFTLYRGFVMRTTLILLTAALLLLASMVTAGSPKKYGKHLTLKEKTKVSDILAAPEKYKGKKVLVEGAVVDVCEKRGCWIELGSDKEFESIIFKVDDGVITFPMSAKGKTARAEGVVSVTTLSKEDRIERGKKQAADEGTTFDPSTITGPKTTVRIMGEGAVIN
jgi:hypothetical protein